MALVSEAEIWWLEQQARSHPVADASEGERQCETHTRPHLEEALTPYTFTAPPIRERKSLRGGGKIERGTEKTGKDVFHRCGSIKSADPNGIQKPLPVPEEVE